MRVTVIFYGITHEVVRERAVSLDVAEGTTVGGLLRLLVENYGKPLEELIFNREGGLSTLVNIAVGNNVIDASRRDVLGLGLREVSGEDSPEVSLTIIPPIFGGESYAGPWAGP